jgi:hypothetical protein
MKPLSTFEFQMATYIPLKFHIKIKFIDLKFVRCKLHMLRILATNTHLPQVNFVYFFKRLTYIFKLLISIIYKLSLSTSHILAVMQRFTIITLF